MPEPKFKFSKQEMRARCEMVRYLTMMGWPVHIQDAIMLKDNPEPEKVRRMIYAYGPDEALRRIRLIVEK